MSAGAIVAGVLLVAAGAAGGAGWNNGKDREGQVKVSAADYKVKSVRIRTAAFAIDADEVSQALYDACVEAGKCPPPAVKGAFPRTPVRGVSFDAAAAYCAFRGRRLPSESEWIRAAYPAGKRQSGFGPPGLKPDDFDVCPHFVVGGYDGDPCPTDRVNDDGKVVRTDDWPRGTDHFVIPAGSFVTHQNQPGAVPHARDDASYPDGVGIRRLFGNVAEWVAPDDPASDPTLGIIRGGSYKRNTGMRIKDRDRAARTVWFDDVGFRCASDIATP
jgi:formylglycine-generating enzyme required for sulfatase activity